MPTDIQIPDDELAGFSDQAREHVRQVVDQYAADLIREANRIEAGRNTANGPPEVTKAMVSDANGLLRRGLTAPKNHWAHKLLRVAASVLSLVVGLMYDPAQLQGQTYMLVFVLVVAATILAVTLAALRD